MQTPYSFHSVKRFPSLLYILNNNNNKHFYNIKSTSIKFKYILYKKNNQKTRQNFFLKFQKLKNNLNRSLNIFNFLYKFYIFLKICLIVCFRKRKSLFGICKTIQHKNISE